MTRDDIIRMAREAGYYVRDFDGVDEVMEGDNYHIQTDTVEQFAALVVAAEREACAKVAETHVLHELADSDDWPDAIAAAIRARGEKK